MNKDHEVDTALNALFEQVKLTGQKLTSQRLRIAQVFFMMPGHHSAEEIFLQTKKTDPKVSLATVYRTLKILLALGMARAHNFEDGQALYEPVFNQAEHHDHLICLTCHKIVEFLNEEIEELQDKVAKEHGFSVKRHRMELYGECQKCRFNVA